MFFARGVRWGLGSICLAVLIGAGCDQPVKDTGRVPVGEVPVVQAAIINPTTSFADGTTNTADFCGGCFSDLDCPQTDNPCDYYRCSGSCGVCEHVVPRGTSCEDGSACTYNSTCDGAGKCAGGIIYSCQGDQCRTAACDGRGGCAFTPKTGASCNDNQPCTYGETCSSTGTCGGGATVTCTSDSCNMRSCNGTATCAVTPLTGAACSDGNACTYGETCSNAGTCGGGTPITCTSDSCNMRSCNGTSSCRVTPRAGTQCDDGNACTYGDLCTAEGSCGGTVITCTSDQYADRSCNGTATCNVVPKAGAACDDGNACTKGDVLQADGSCRGMAYTCALGECLASSTCDGKGGCQQVAKMDGTGCNADNSQCTPKDVCHGGVCVPDPTPVTCIERDCNTVACNPGTGNCDYKPTSGGACGVSGCFSSGTCNNGQCSGTPKDCSSYNGACTTGLCDAATGNCVATPKLNGTDCSPGGMCTTAAACAFGVCELTTQTCPAPSSPCKVASCRPADGTCVESSRPTGAACDPKNSCISDATCDESGSCRGTPALNGSPCTLAGGAVGECAAGTCVGNGPPPADAGADGPVATTDGPPATTDATAPRGAGSSGCAVGGAEADAGSLAVLVLVGAFVSLVRRTRRRRR
jgi:hypothetical protein